VVVQVQEMAASTTIREIFLFALAVRHFQTQALAAVEVLVLLMAAQAALA
jgi:hypothetical protein